MNVKGRCELECAHSVLTRMKLVPLESMAALGFWAKDVKAKYATVTINYSDITKTPVTDYA